MSAISYINELNSINSWELTHPLSATAYKTMMKLYHLANMERFPDRITVANRVLMSMVGCSEDSLIRARNQLIEYGRIDYNGKKRHAPVYVIRYFSEEKTANNQRYNPRYNPQDNPEDNSKFAGYSKGYKRDNPQDNTQDNPGYNPEDNPEDNYKYAGYTANIYIDKTREDKRREDIYISHDEDLDRLCEEIAERSGHRGNIAYIDGIRRNLKAGGAEAIRNAREELARTAVPDTRDHGYQSHGYTEDDFGDDFYYDCSRAFDIQAAGTDEERNQE